MVTPPRGCVHRDLSGDDYQHVPHSLPPGDDGKCLGGKTVWAKHEAEELTVSGNQPLIDLMLALSTVMRRCYHDAALSDDLVLWYFDDPLAPDKKWPEDDKAISRAGVVPANNRMGSNNHRHGDGSKRNVGIADGVEHPPRGRGGPGASSVSYHDDANPVAVACARTSVETATAACRLTLARQVDQLEAETAPANGQQYKHRQSSQRTRPPLRCGHIRQLSPSSSRGEKCTSWSVHRHSLEDYGGQRIEGS